MSAQILEATTYSPSQPPPPSVNHKPSSAHRFAKAESLTSQRPNQSYQPLRISHLNHHQVYAPLLLEYKPLKTSAYASVLDSCKCPNFGKQVHAHAIKNGFHGHEFVETKFLQMYVRSGCFEDANLLFDTMPLRNLYSWTAILTLHLDNGLFEEAFELFRELQFQDLGLDFFVFPVVFNICSGLARLELARQLHGMVAKYPFFANIYVGNAVIDMYGKCGSLDDAKKVFTLMSDKDSVSWNSIVTACAANGMVYEALELLQKMKSLDYAVANLVSWSAIIGGFAQNGYDEEAIELLSRMLAEGLEPNAQTLASVLPACARLQKISLGKELHGYITRHEYMYNRFVANGLVDVYRRCGDMSSALNVFSKFSVKNAVSYNTMIVGYCETGMICKAKELFDHMELMGVKRDLISWNSMISGYVDNFLFEKALNMFRDLLMVEEIKPDSFTLGSVLKACADTASLEVGKQIHSLAIVRGLKSNTFVGGALVEMYCKCWDIVAAQTAFDEVDKRDVPTWNALISGYARCNQIEIIQSVLDKMKEDGFEQNVYTWNGILAGHVENDHLDLAMQLFCEMQTLNLRPDIYTVGIILPACSRLATLERGKQLHAYSIRFGYESDVHIGAALINMYAKCGCMKYAMLSYNRISNPNLVSHNAMLTAYAMHGNGEHGIALFCSILANNFRPDNVTFLSALSSCIHAGTIETGLEIFELMAFYNMEPTLKHYTSMVDLLSRSGELQQAYELIERMPMEPDSVLWGALLAGCVIHGNVELGETAAERLIELEPNSAGNYVLLANLYSNARRWVDLARIRQIMKDRGLRKSPGCSWIEDKEEIHAFLSCDRSHKKTEEIYATLDNLTLYIKTERLA